MEVMQDLKGSDWTSIRIYKRTARRLLKLRRDTKRKMANPYREYGESYDYIINKLLNYLEKVIKEKHTLQK